MKPRTFPLFARTAREFIAPSAIALTCVSLLGSAALSQADVLVSDNFDSYADGALNGANGGTGFSDAWNSSINVGSGLVGGNAPSFRNFTGNTFGNSGTRWVSFDWGYNSTPSENASYGGLTFYAGGGERFLIGNTWPGAGHNVWRMSNGGTTSELNHPVMKTAVAKITLGAGSTSTVELWVGPTGSPVDVSGPALATVTTANLEGVDGIRIMGQDFGGVNSAFDNFVIGETANDVDASDTPPLTTSGTWTNTAGGLWGTAGSWLSDIVATGSGSTADFNTLDITGDTTVDLDSARTIGNLVFGDTDTSSAAGWTLTNNGTPGNVLILAGTTPTITVNALGDTKTATISAVVTGSSGLTKSGTGTLTLSAANACTGATNVDAGKLQISGQPYFNIGRTTTVAPGAVLELNDSNNSFTSLMPVSTITGAGTFRLSGNSTINQSLNGVTGTRLTIDMQAGGLIDLLDTSRLTNGGWQVLNWTTNQASMNIASGATFDIWDGQAVTIDALNGSGTVDKVHPDPATFMLNIGVAGGSGTFSGTIQNTSGAGAIALTKVGTGNQTLSGPNTYTGNTSVEEGTLSIAPGGSLRFRPTTSGQTNTLSGTATATLSYLGTVDLDLSAANTTDGNFWNLVNVGSFSGPTPTLTPAAVTSTLGAFDEASPGTWELSVTGAKWTFTEGDGTLTYEVTATPYEIWGLPYGLTAGSEGGDLDSDGLTNFAEFAFGLIPNSGASVNPIAAPLDKASGTFSYTRRTTSGLTYSVWFSQNLADWTEDTAAAEGIPVPNGENETVEITLSDLPGDPLPAKLFIQVRTN
jgi:autotransporter-associated beta strand protein